MARSTTTFLGTSARVTAVLGGGVALTASLRDLSPDSYFDPALVFFFAWSLLPWVLTYRLARGPHPAPIRDGLLVILGVFWALQYGDLLFPPERQSSTSAVAYVFIPLWHLLCLLVPAAMRLWQRWSRRRHQARSRARSSQAT